MNIFWIFWSFEFSSSWTRVHEMFVNTIHEHIMNMLWTLHSLEMFMNCSWIVFMNISWTCVHELENPNFHEQFMNSSWKAWNVHEFMNCVSQGSLVSRAALYDIHLATNTFQSKWTLPFLSEDMVHEKIWGQSCWKPWYWHWILYSMLCLMITWTTCWS